MGERQRFREASVPIGGNVVPPALGISRNLSRVFENTIGNGWRHGDEPERWHHTVLIVSSNRFPLLIPIEPM